jgi:hypothetical protein
VEFWTTDLIDLMVNNIDIIFNLRTILQFTVHNAINWFFELLIGTETSQNSSLT